MTGGGYRLLASANFGELVLGCIEAKFCNQILIFLAFRDLQNYLADFLKKLQNLQKIAKFCKFVRNFLIFAKKVLIFAKIADF